MLQTDAHPAVLSPSQIFHLLIFILQQTSNLTTLRHKHSFILHPERRENIPADLPTQPFKGSFSSKIKQEAGKYIHKVFIVNGFKQENLRDEICFCLLVWFRRKHYFHVAKETFWAGDL